MEAGSSPRFHRGQQHAVLRMEEVMGIVGRFPKWGYLPSPLFLTMAFDHPCQEVLVIPRAHVANMRPVVIDDRTIFGSC